MEAWLQQPETKEVWKYLSDLKNQLKDAALGINEYTGSLEIISEKDLPMVNKLCGNIECLNVLLRLDYNLIRDFYIEQKMEIKEDE